MHSSNIFKIKKVKKTPARKAILNLFNKIKKPISSDEITGKLNQKGIKVNRTTVFRNINLMTKKGLINKVEFNEGKFRYESSFLPHHHHLICKKCKAIKDIKSDLLYNQINKLSKKVKALYGFQIEDHKIEFFGKCKNCKKLN